MGNSSFKEEQMRARAAYVRQLVSADSHEGKCIQCCLEFKQIVGHRGMCRDCCLDSFDVSQKEKYDDHKRVEKERRRHRENYEHSLRMEKKRLEEEARFADRG